MRVLLINPEFPGSFWSLQQSCELLGRKTLMPPLGLLTLAALLPADWELRLVDLNARRLSPGDWDWAELVMLSGMIVQREGLLHLIREAKARHKTVVVGGPYATSVPQEVLEAGADFLVRGEGEITIPLWLAAWQAGETHGVIEPDGRPEMTALAGAPLRPAASGAITSSWASRPPGGVRSIASSAISSTFTAASPVIKAPIRCWRSWKPSLSWGGGGRSLSATTISSATRPMPGPSSRS